MFKKLCEDSKSMKVVLGRLLGKINDGHQSCAKCVLEDVMMRHVCLRVCSAHRVCKGCAPKGVQCVHSVRAEGVQRVCKGCAKGVQCVHSVCEACSTQRVRSVWLQHVCVCSVCAVCSLQCAQCVQCVQ